MQQDPTHVGQRTRRKVLIVDDQAKICFALGEYFTFRGYDVRTVFSGEEAIALQPAYHPEVVLLDLLMPGLGGVETLKQLKRTQPCPTVIMMSVADHEEVVQGSLHLGADFYVTKPIDFSKLEELVSGYFGSAPHSTPV